MKRKLKILRYIEFVLSFILAISITFGKMDSELGLIIKNPFNYFLVPIYALLIVVVFVEFKFCKPWIRASLGFLSFVIVLYMLKESIAEANATCFLFGLICFCFSIFGLFTTGKLETEGKKNTYPVGFFSKKQLMYTFLAILITILFWVFIGVNSNNIKNIYLVLLGYNISFILIFICVCIVTYNNPLAKAIKKINIDLCYEDFANALKNIKIDKLHPDSLKYLNLINANYLYTYNKNEGIALYNKISAPSTRSYLIFYHLVGFINAINMGDFAKAQDNLVNFKQMYPKYNRKRIIIYEKVLLIYETNKTIDNIETFFPVNTKYLFNNVTNSTILLTYYVKQNNKEKVLYYANYILSKNSDLKEINKIAAEAKLAFDSK